ncbi:unnamed protein product [Heligmosomoides polygyrus]|uniref:Peptidase A2 domain-containing protein n=1 Tax=Heligmosomoides polygyrus TaxID=6339 RepID=A0A183GLV7_HELPZ|nr:unnamed protein product [Heligmosomoides polygyrus]
MQFRYLPVSHAAPTKTSDLLPPINCPLLAVEGAAHSSVSLIRHAFREVCERTNSLSLALQVALRVEPTFVMRALLQRPDISASYLGNGYVQVRRCIELPSTSVRLLPFNGTCYDAPRAELRLPSGSIWHAFLTPATGIVRRHATVTDCSESGTFMLPSADGVQQFSPHDGSWSTVPTRDVRQVSSFPRLHAFNIPSRLTIFHNLVLTNFSEVADDHGLRELWTALDHKQLMDHFARVDTSSHGSFGSSPSAGHQVGSSFFFPFWSFSIFDFWVSICCLYVSFLLFRSILVLYIHFNFPQFWSLLSSRRSAPAASTTTTTQLPDTASPRAVVPLAPGSFLTFPSPRRGPIELDISQVEIDATQVWPPRASLVPMQVLSLADSPSFFVSQVPVKVNGVQMLALIDTGAGITVAARTILPLLGIFHLQPCVVPAAVGVAGIPVHFVGCALVTTQIGSTVLSYLVHFTACDGVLRSADAYNIILGNDILQKLSRWALNYSERKLFVGGEPIPIVSASPDPTLSASTVSVHANTTVLLPPASEVMVPCYLSGAHPCDVTLCSEGTVLPPDGILIAPLVCHASNMMLFLSNPPNAPRIIYRGQHLTSAHLVFDTPNDSVFRPSPYF